MNVTFEKTDELNGILSVSLEKADYDPKVEEQIKNYRKKAQIPGFRPGTAPVPMIKKLYGKLFIAEEVNKLAHILLSISRQFSETASVLSFSVQSKSGASKVEEPSSEKVFESFEDVVHFLIHKHLEPLVCFPIHTREQITGESKKAIGGRICENNVRILCHFDSMF